MKVFSPPLNYVIPGALPPSLIDLALTSSASVLEHLALGLSDTGEAVASPTHLHQNTATQTQYNLENQKLVYGSKPSQGNFFISARPFNRSLSVSSLLSVKLCQIVQVADAIQLPKYLLISLQVRLFLMPPQAPCSSLHGIVPACGREIGLDDLWRPLPNQTTPWFYDYVIVLCSTNMFSYWGGKVYVPVRTHLRKLATDFPSSPGCFSCLHCRDFQKWTTVNHVLHCIFLPLFLAWLDRHLNLD